MNKNKSFFNLFNYPVSIWIMIWLIYFMIHLQFSFVISVGKSTMITLAQFIVYYLVSKILIPRYFEKDRRRFIMLTTGLVIFVNFIATFLELFISTNLGETGRPPLLLSGFLQFVLITAALWVSISLYMFNKERDTQKKMESLKNEKAETELKFLKAQINPHFLFNALNNIYTIAYIGDKTTPDKIAMLSEMLRYVLYDCNSEYVPLEKEVEYLKNYIAFQQLKTENEQRIIMNIQVENVHARIAPMIMIPFVENAFKHSGIIKDKKGFVELKIKQKDNELSFSVRNSIMEAKTETGKLNSGIGIENLENRLKLLYKNKFRLKVEEKRNEYFTRLNISL